MLWKHIEDYRKREFSIVLGLIVLASFFEVFSISAFMPVLAITINPDLVDYNKNIQEFISRLGFNKYELRIIIISIFCFNIILSAITRILLVRMISKFSLDVCSDICAEIFLRAISQPYIIQVSRNSSDTIHAILSQTNSMIYEIVLPILNIISSVVMGTIILTCVIFYSPWFALTTFTIFAFLYTFIGLFSKKQLQLNGEILNKESNNLVRVVQESLGSIRDILLDNSQFIYFNSFQASNVSLRRTQAKIAFISSTPRYVIESVGMVIIAMSILFADGSSNNESILMIPLLGGIALAAQRLLPIFQQAFSSWVAIRSGSSSLRDVLDILALPKVSLLEKPNKLNFNHNIEFKDIAFSYNSGANLIVRNINLNIPKGGKIGIIGKTGSGKSTLLDILMGLLSPTSGELVVDNKPLSSSNIHGWQSNISHVPQAIYLSDGTISENIAFGIPENFIDHILVAQCAKQAQLSDLIESWPDKYKTNVGERGVKLSGGQRQRIGIARALYKQSEVIIFDEATSSLDSQTEQEVMNAINELNEFLTIIIVAHRISTLKNCSKIYKLDAGIISEVKLNEIDFNK